MINYYNLYYISIGTIICSLVSRRILQLSEERRALVEGASAEGGQRVAGFLRVARLVLFDQILVGGYVGCRHSEQVVRMTVSVFRLVAGRSAHRRRGRGRRRRDRCIDVLFETVDGRQTGRRRNDRRGERNRRRKSVSRTVFEKRGGPRRAGAVTWLCVYYKRRRCVGRVRIGRGRRLQCKGASAAQHRVLYIGGGGGIGHLAYVTGVQAAFTPRRIRPRIIVIR